MMKGAHVMIRRRVAKTKADKGKRLLVVAAMSIAASGLAGAVFPEISQVQERISHAKRLLAHSQGDEHQAGRI